VSADITCGIFEESLLDVFEVSGLCVEEEEGGWFFEVGWAFVYDDEGHGSCDGGFVGAYHAYGVEPFFNELVEVCESGELYEYVHGAVEEESVSSWNVEFQQFF
jgi:hypothetical protein